MTRALCPLSPPSREQSTSFAWCAAPAMPLSSRQRACCGAAEACLTRTGTSSRLGCSTECLASSPHPRAAMWLTPSTARPTNRASQLCSGTSSSTPAARTTCVTDASTSISCRAATMGTWRLNFSSRPTLSLRWCGRIGQTSQTTTTPTKSPSGLPSTISRSQRICPLLHGTKCHGGLAEFTCLCSRGGAGSRPSEESESMLCAWV
mmetsp:Transcript_80998/g.217344  ORF Transcript_80998/g.217344 Transcript_80998/m.217344 type:complete len:206 (+) Transcript_80998:2309-2926(+)